MKLNRKFAKKELKQGGIPDYAPAVLKVITHHHEEWDEDVLDPETGEPTGETWHKERDWDTEEIKLWPTAADYIKMEYVPVIDKFPTEPASAGFHWEAAGWEASKDAVRRTYVMAEDPPAPPVKYSVKKVAGKIRELGYTQAVREALMQANAYEMYVGANYLLADDEDFLATKQLVQQVTGITDADVG